MQLTTVEALELTFQFEAIFEAFPDILFKLSRDGKILSCKTGRQANYIFKPEQFVGAQIADILPQLCMKKFKNAVAGLTKEGDISQLEFPFEQDKRKYWFEARLVPHYKHEVIAILRDITDKKKTEEEVKELEALHKAASNLQQATGPATEQTLQAKIDEYNQLNEKLNYEISLRRGMESNVKMYLEELKKRNRELEHFRYLSGNDFQEPLRTMNGFARILNRRYSQQLDAEGQEMLGLLEKGSEQMQQIIFNLSDYANINATIKKEPVKAEERLNIALRSLSREIHNKNIDFNIHDLPVLQAERKQLTMLFEQIISNAIKFSRKNVKLQIEIGATEQDTCWQFYVKDNGIGFKPELQSRIFMLFQRLHARNKYYGAGIGLAFCKKIVENHGGKIWADSVPGKGSVFYFTLPK